jgi:hypothetical protein
MSIDTLGSVYTVWEERETSGPRSDIVFKRNTISFDPSINLTNYDTGASGEPDVAASGNNVYVVWYDARPGRYQEIFYTRSTDGGANFGWILNLSNNTGASSWPAVAASGNNVYVVWGDTTPGNPDILYRRSTDSGANFGSTVNLSNTVGGSGVPDVAASGNNVYVVWVDSTPGNPDILYRRSTDSGANFGSTVNLSNTISDSFYPAVAASNNLT